jgi:hypothetical protein
MTTTLHTPGLFAGGGPGTGIWHVGRKNTSTGTQTDAQHDGKMGDGVERTEFAQNVANEPETDKQKSVYVA